MAYKINERFGGKSHIQHEKSEICLGHEATQGGSRGDPHNILKENTKSHSPAQARAGELFSNLNSADAKYETAKVAKAEKAVKRGNLGPSLFLYWQQAMADYFSEVVMPTSSERTGAYMKRIAAGLPATADHRAFITFAVREWGQVISARFRWRKGNPPHEPSIPFLASQRCLEIFWEEYRRTLGISSPVQSREVTDKIAADEAAALKAQLEATKKKLEQARGTNEFLKAENATLRKSSLIRPAAKPVVKPTLEQHKQALADFNLPDWDAPRHVKPRPKK